MAVVAPGQHTVAAAFPTVSGDSGIAAACALIASHGSSVLSLDVDAALAPETEHRRVNEFDLSCMSRTVKENT
jgi:hypothetical protein